MNRFVDGTQTKPLVLQLIVHAVNQTVQLVRIRRAAGNFFKRLVLRVSFDQPIDRRADSRSADLRRSFGILSYHSYFLPDFI